ncbi:MAG: hypothetical protein ACFFCW_48315, partial [Candidatus Hodarchaeota archaeon]
DYVQLVGGSYTSFGEWGLPPGMTMGAPTYIDSSLLLADGTGWTVADNLFTQVKGPPVTTLTTLTTVVLEFGNEILVMLFSMGLVGIIPILMRRKRRK